MALKFERQIARAPNIHLARDAITNRACRNIAWLMVYATGNDEFVDRTRQVFARLRLKGLRLQAKKTKLGLAKIDYVGEEIPAKGLSKSTNHIRAFLDIPRPKTVTDPRKFLGVGNYFHQFIANHSAVVTHLH